MTPALQDTPEVHALKCELAREVLCFSGKLRLQVNGWSMLPSIRPGDTLLVEQAKSDGVSEGDIVLFGRDHRLCAHRVLKRLNHSQLLTRGDAMPAPDPVVPEAHLLGRVCFIVRKGKWITPSRKMGLSETAVAGAVRKSAIGARIVARLCDERQNS